MDEYSAKTSDYVGKILSEKRKAKKPLMEKMRRARINDSLNELKFLVLDALNKDVSRYSKMEKADVLEMAVQHLRDLKRMEKKRQDAVTPYRTGLSSRHRAEVDSRPALPRMEETDQLRAHILSHMASSCYQGNSSPTSPVGPVLAATPVTWLTYPSPPPSPTMGYTTPLPSGREVPSSKSAYGLEESKRRPTNAPAPLWRPW